MYYKDPNVFSAHTVMLTQAFPLWGKRSLRREAALADVNASRGRARAAQDELDEKVKVAYAQYYLTARDLAVNREIAGLARRMRAAASARYGQGGGDQVAVIQALGEETTAKTEEVRLAGAYEAARARLNVLIGRSASAPLSEPTRARPIPAAEPALERLVGRARAANRTLAARTATIDAARMRSSLADKAWYPDITVGAGPLIPTNNRPVGFAATLGSTSRFLGDGRQLVSGRRQRGSGPPSSAMMRPALRSRAPWPRALPGSGPRGRRRRS